MAATRVTSGLHQLHAHANVRDNGLEYLIELDVSNVEPRLNRRAPRRPQSG
jgi:hypothetical protein